MASKSILRINTHTVLSGLMLEVWHDGQMVASVYGADGPGVRIITKYPVTVKQSETGGINIVEVIVTP